MGERTLTIEDVKANPSLMDLFIEENKGLVNMITPTYVNKGFDHDDIFQCGCIGMYKAVRNFNLETGTKFSTYAIPMIIGEIQRFLRDSNVYSMVKVSRAIRSIFYKQLKLAEAGKSDDEICAELQIEKEDLITARIALQPCAYLEDEIRGFGKDDGAPIRLLDKIPCDYDLGEKVTEKLELKEKFRILKELLPDREYKTLMLRVKQDLTQEDIAKHVDVTQASVSRILKKVDKVVHDINRYFEGEIEYKELVRKYKFTTEPKKQKEGKQLKYRKQVEAIVNWAIEHPGENIYISEIIRGAGLDPKAGFLSSFKTQAIKRLEEQGYVIIKDRNSWHVEKSGKEQPSAVEQTVVKDLPELKVTAIFIVQGEFSTYTVQDGKISFSQSEVPLDRLGDYLGELRQVSDTIQQRLTA